MIWSKLPVTGVKGAKMSSAGVVAAKMADTGSILMVSTGLVWLCLQKSPETHNASVFPAQTDLVSP